MTGPEARRAVVVGAGIGGLATAVGLGRCGWQVTLLERAPELREAGAGMSLLSNAQRCLDRLGAGAAARALSAEMMPGGDGVHTPRGRRLMRPTDPVFVRDHGLSTMVLLRRDLQRVLQQALPAGCLRTGAEAVGVDGAGVRYRTADGEHTAGADVVVAADGVHSRLRAGLFPDAPGPVHSGHSVWRGITGRPFTPEEGGTAWGRGREFARMPLADGRVYWYAVANTPAGAQFRDHREEVLRRFGTWHGRIRAMVESTPAETVLHHDVLELPRPLPGYVRGRVALLGDAAHAMTSDLGQGACQALEDAVVLCAELAAGPDVPAALARYDRIRRPRSQMVAEASRRMGRMKLTERPLQLLVRNLALLVTPPRAGERAMARIGDWHPPVLPGPQTRSTERRGVG
ncbi:FAD-dependent monooxygenase [Streptomyces sp. NPDC001404]|uniref:FAD-dependent monooxygenase n=1 Tax=Streptomyces sp. NPDC001404 TaxID=3364571 RepID=UPI0036A42617